MSPAPLQCGHCGYEIATYAEAIEAHEAGSNCLLCGGQLDSDALERLVDDWTDEEIFEEGEARAETEGDLEGEEDLFEGVLDFGDEGEDEEDPLF